MIVRCVLYNFCDDVAPLLLYFFIALVFSICAYTNFYRQHELLHKLRHVEERLEIASNNHTLRGKLALSDLSRAQINWYHPSIKSLPDEALLPAYDEHIAVRIEIRSLGVSLSHARGVASFSFSQLFLVLAQATYPSLIA